MTDVVHVLMEMRSGKVATYINEKFNDVLRAVLDTGGKGEVTIKLSIKPSKLGMGGVVLEVDMDADTKIKKPELAIGTSVFFVDKDGSLTREDPDQMGLLDAQEEIHKEQEQNSGRRTQ